MTFDEMNPLQRRLHNAALVIEAEGDDHGFAKLQRDAIDALQPNTQEPVGEVQHLDELNEQWTKHLPIGTKLYTRPAPQQPADSAWKDALLEQMANHGMDHGGTPEEVVKALIEMAVTQATDPAINQPPAQQTKPLTGEQIIEIAHFTQSAEPGQDGYILPISFARAIEAAHNIGVKP